jgi:hypothetical protein
VWQDVVVCNVWCCKKVRSSRSKPVRALFSWSFLIFPRCFRRHVSFAKTTPHATDTTIFIRRIHSARADNPAAARCGLPGRDTIWQRSVRRSSRETPNTWRLVEQARISIGVPNLTIRTRHNRVVTTSREGPVVSMDRVSHCLLRTVKFVCLCRSPAFETHSIQSRTIQLMHAHRFQW